MSDYLWDKTGERDAETERLEELLGQLRFQPTPFDLPAELPAKDFRAARRQSALSWPRLAVAASLTLAVLAGAWLALRQQTRTSLDDPQQLASQNIQPAAVEKPTTAVPTTAAPTTSAAAGGEGLENKNVERPAVAVPPVENSSPRNSRAATRFRPRRPDLARDAGRGGATVNRAVVAGRATPREKFAPEKARPAPREETARITPAEREAAEKVLYALRLTSEKLNYARRQVQEVSRNEANR